MKSPSYVLLLSIMLVSACGSDRPPGARNSMDNGDVEAEVDAAEEFADAGPEDERDAAEPADASVGECEGDALTFATASSPGRTYSAAILGDRVHLAYLVTACDVMGSNGPRAISYTSFLTTGDPSGPELAANGGAVCAVTRDPLLMASPADGIELVYGSNAPGSYSLLWQPSLEAGMPDVLSSPNVLALSPQGTHLTSAQISTVVFSEQDGEPVPPMPAAIVAAQPGMPERSVAPESDGFHAQKIALLSRDSAGFAGMAAWVSDTVTRPGVFARHLADDGSAAGELLSLTDALGSASDVAFASTTDDNAALVYVVDAGEDARTLRFRAIDADFGLGREVRLTSSNERVGAVAIAPYAHGYAVLYRRLLGGGDPNPQSLRLLFVDAEGNVAGSRFVANDTGTSTDLTLLSSSDGRLVALWSANLPSMAGSEGDPSPGVYAARLHCL